jgi:hypothetical protein
MDGIRTERGFTPRLIATRSVWAVLALMTAVAAGACWALAQAKAQTEEEKVRDVAREYYFATVTGSSDRCVATVRLPMTVISNGLVSSRSETQLRGLLARVAAKANAKPLTAADRARVDERIRAMFEEADVTFVGADTASVDFLVRAGTKPEDGDLIAMLLLYRTSRNWRVIAEIHDSNPVPRSYLPPELPVPSAAPTSPPAETPAPANPSATPDTPSPPAPPVPPAPTETR